MCFSATASFVAALGLGGVALATWRQAPRRAEWALAAFPALFATQQLVEGALWLRLDAGVHDAATAALTQGFLAFALVLWPMLVPLATFLAEPQAPRRRLLLPLVCFGLLIGGYLLWGMLAAPYVASIDHASIRYNSAFAHIRFIEYYYLLGIALPMLLSSSRPIIVLGLANTLLLSVSKLLYETTYVSVWCFFAAIASVLVLAHFATRPASPRQSA